MEQFTVGHLPQATRAFEFIRNQLLDLAKDCSLSLETDQVSPDKFRKVEKQLEKLLHETRAACCPPPATPVMTDFEVVKPLGRGAFGAVSLVRHHKSREVFAMKEIKLQDPNQKHAVLLERDILSHLDNPLVVSLFCSFQTEDHMCMVMELVGGGDVGHQLKSCGWFDVDLARFYTAELVSAVQHIHSCGILHRDLKPDNLMVTNDGHIKVTDFGIAKFGSVDIPCLTEDDCQRVAAEFTDGQSCGTPLYMAPELYRGTGYGKPIDWWATGAILYRFLFGFTPFGYAAANNFDDHVKEDEVPWLDDEYPQPPDALSLMHQLLDKNPITRLGTRGASEVKGHLFFKDVDWDTLHTQTPPPIPPAKDEEASQGAGGAPQPLDAPAEEDDWQEAPVMVADFCYVAFRFREVYGSAQPLSSQTPHPDYWKVEQEQDMMGFDGGFDGGFDYGYDDRFDDRYDEDYDEDPYEDYDDGFHEDSVEMDSSSAYHLSSVVSVDHSVVECQSSDVLAASQGAGGAPQPLDAPAEEDDWQEAGFCYVALRFREVYGSAQPLSSQTPHPDYCKVEQEQEMMGFDGGFDGGFDYGYDDRFDDRYDDDYDEDPYEDYDDGFHEDSVELDSSSAYHHSSVVSVDHSVVECQSSDVLAASTRGNPEIQLDEDDGSTPQNGPISHCDISQEICNTWNITIHDSSEDNIDFTAEEDSSPDNITVTVEEDCGEEDHEPEVWKCQSADVLEAATPSGFVESSSRSNWPRTAARRCRKAWRASKAFWSRVLNRWTSVLTAAPFHPRPTTPRQSERSPRQMV